MGEPVSYEIRKLLQERKLLQIKPDRKLVTKEIKGAEYDLSRAMESLSNSTEVVNDAQKFLNAAKQLLRFR